MRLRLIFGLVVLSLLSACAKAPQQQATSLQQLRNPATIEQWQARGKVAFKRGKQGGHANFTWDNERHQFKLRLYGPIGGQGVLIEGTPQQVQMIDQEGKQWLANSPEKMIYQSLGWQVPVSGLKYWILGLAEPNSPSSKQYDESKQLVELFQAGWRVRYQEFQMVEGFRLPRGLQLTNGPIRLKVLIRNWQTA